VTETKNKPDATVVESGEGTRTEQEINRYAGNFIHLFLSCIALLVVAAAVVATVQFVIHGFPELWRSPDIYQSLHVLLQRMLLVAIAAELGLLLLFHRTSAALEVVMFVIARRMVATDVSALDLLFGSAALAGLLVVRYYYLPGTPK
jgi:hypothetical protein